MFGDSYNSRPTNGRTLTATLTEHAAYTQSHIALQLLTAVFVSAKKPSGLAEVSSKWVASGASSTVEGGSRTIGNYCWSESYSDVSATDTSISYLNFMNSNINNNYLSFHSANQSNLNFADNKSLNVLLESVDESFIIYL